MTFYDVLKQKKFKEKMETFTVWQLGTSEKARCLQPEPLNRTCPRIYPSCRRPTGH